MCGTKRSDDLQYRKVLNFFSISSSILKHFVRSTLRYQVFLFVLPQVDFSKEDKVESGWDEEDCEEEDFWG